MNWQSEQLTQALAFIGLINLAGKLTDAEALTNLSATTEIALGLGASSVLSSQSGAPETAGSGGAGGENFLLPLGLGFLLAKNLNRGGDVTSSDVAKQ